MARLPWDIERDNRKYTRGAPSASPYHTWKWARLSRAFRMEHPLCEECKRKGILRPSTCVDHIIPWPICADRFYDRSNLQALCEHCNIEKGNRDKRIIREWRRTHPEGGGASNLSAATRKTTPPLFVPQKVNPKDKKRYDY